MKIEDARRNALPALKALCERSEFKKEDVMTALDCIITSYTDLDFLTGEKQVLDMSIKDIFTKELQFYLQELKKM